MPKKLTQKLGRPKKETEPQEALNVAIPARIIKMLDKDAARYGATRRGCVLAALVSWLGVEDRRPA